MNPESDDPVTAKAVAKYVEDKLEIVGTPSGIATTLKSIEMDHPAGIEGNLIVTFVTDPVPDQSSH
jgi:hypothetical protein